MRHIAAAATEPAELGIVAMAAAPGFEDKDELVLGALKRTHLCIVLGPHAEVFEPRIGLTAGGKQFAEMAPIDTDIEERTAGAESREVAQTGGEKYRKPRTFHLACRHRERAMADGTDPGGVTADRHVKGGSVNIIAALSARITEAKAVRSSALPHTTRWPPSSHKSPGWLTAGPDAISGTASARSGEGAGGSSSEANRRSISATSKPVT